MGHRPQARHRRDDAAQAGATAPKQASCIGCGRHRHDKYNSDNEGGIATISPRYTEAFSINDPRR
jgi:hypothetical protein